MNKEKVLDCFQKNVANHVMKVEKDDGLHRHLVFRNVDGSWNHWFGISTWPGFLCVYGDMGTFVFRCIEDMFKFFRSKNDELQINLGYWHEKVEAQDRSTGVRVYDPKKAQEIINELIEELITDESLSEEETIRFREELEDEVLCYIDEGEHSFRNAIDQVNFIKNNGDRLSFQNFWEQDLTSYTFRYIWCCYAIVWAIKQYDKLKTQSTEAS